MNTKQLAIFMGVSLGWVYKNKKLLPHRRIGSLYFFHKPTIQAWLSEGHVPDEQSGSVKDVARKAADTMFATI